MANKKYLLLTLVVLFVAFEGCFGCNYDTDCIFHGENAHCCEDNICYKQDEPCPVVATLAKGIIAAIVISVIVFIAIIGAIICCCCCACCRSSSPGHIVVTQPAYQQFGVSTHVATTNVHQPPPQPYGYAPPPPPYSQPPPGTQPPPMKVV